MKAASMAAMMAGSVTMRTADNECSSPHRWVTDRDLVKMDDECDSSRSQIHLESTAGDTPRNNCEGERSTLNRDDPVNGRNGAAGT
jgi:hypothetical protein